MTVAFNAGFASTVALIMVNTITERGTLVVNALCAMVAAGIAYPVAEGVLFNGGPVSGAWRFIDTGGACTIHVLGGALGLVAALWVGPRSRARAWTLLGRTDITETRDNIPLTVIGAFL